MTRSGLFGTLSLLIVMPLAAQQAVITSAKDNTLYQDAGGATSNGVGEHMFVGRNSSTGGGAIRRALVAFDVAGFVPAGATITSVTLRLNMSKTGTGETNVSLHRVTKAWGEGTSNADANEGQGAASTTGDATWIDAIKGTSAWTAAGGDFESTVSAGLAVVSTGAYVWGSTAGMVADVQSWLDNPSGNFGWIIIGDESTSPTTKRFDTRENSASANRPSLTVNYTTSTGVVESEALPSAPEILHSYPNPFNPATRIVIRLPEKAHVELSVTSPLGRHVATLANGTVAEGLHEYTFDARGLPSGMYFCTLRVDGRMTGTQRMILLK